MKSDKTDIEFPSSAIVQVFIWIVPRKKTPKRLFSIPNKAIYNKDIGDSESLFKLTFSVLVIFEVLLNWRTKNDWFTNLFFIEKSEKTDETNDGDVDNNNDDEEFVDSVDAK